MTSSALFGILQLDRGEPLGFANFSGLVQAWLQDAGGFAAVGLLLYILYALTVPTDKSVSERLRVPLTRWMVGMGALALVCYAALLGVFVLKASNQTSLLGRPLAPPPVPLPLPGMPIKPEPPVWHSEWQPMLLMLGGLFAILGFAEPFVRDMNKICRRNFQPGAMLAFAAASVARMVLLLPALLVLLVWSVVGSEPAASATGGEEDPSTQPGTPGPVRMARWVMAFSIPEGPVWAVAKLSFLEAVRSRLLWVFVIILLPFLFPVTWFVPVKPSDELRTTVAVVSVVLMVLVLFPALLLSSFSLPNDIKTQTIHTVVTKPVERFEIVLGRFVGYTFLMTLVLAGLTAFSLVLINSTKLNEKAEEETAKARMPIRGKLEFRSARADFDGTNVGREFDYRKYIPGGPNFNARAIWRFPEIPSSLATAPNDAVPIEYTFDIFKLTKGEENKGVSVQFRFVTHNCPQRPPDRPGEKQGEWQWEDKTRQQRYIEEVTRLTREGRNPVARPGTPGWAEANRLAEEYGIFEFGGKQVYDYTVGGVEVPAGLFRNALQGSPGTEMAKDGTPRTRARVTIYVKCESGGQLLGMAEPDLYILEGNQPFSVNFVKGAIGLWCRLCIVIGLAVACSTYLSGVLSLLVAGFIYVLGYLTDHLNDLAAGRNVGGGPAESAFRLSRAEVPTAPLPEGGAGNWLIKAFDTFWAWVVRRVQNVIPDVESFTWTHFVSEGFNVNAEYLIINILVTIGYLLPWGLVAYYLMKSREVAN